MPLAAIALASISQVVCGQPADDAVARFKSCLQWDGAARQECFDKLSRDLSGGSAPSPAQSSGENWVISETTSPVDYSPQITAAISSASAVKDAPSSFAIRCRGARIELLVSTIGSWRPSNNGEFKVAYRIDDQPAVEEQWAAFAGGRGAIFKGEVTRFLRPLREEGRLSIRVYDWQGPPHDATFQLSGLEDVRRRFGAFCKW
jgi:hypothetical protein